MIYNRVIEGWLFLQTLTTASAQIRHCYLDRILALNDEDDDEELIESGFRRK